MAIDSLSIDERGLDERRPLRKPASLPGRLIYDVGMALASLRLTVALFAMAIFLIFAGTMAQVDKDIWEVMAQYFRTWVAWIPLQIFFPRSFFTGEPPQVPGTIPFPGGWMIGTAMGINLLAAHSLRFKIQATGARLAAGLATIAIGVVLTWLVVVGGSGKETIEGAAPVEYATLWSVLKWCLAGLWLAGLYGLIQFDRARIIERWGLFAFELVLGGVLAYLLASGDQASLGDSSMRILWQLIKGGLAALVLLAGCWLVFRKRAGIVLLHAGVALVMANELVVHNLHVEGQMRIKEGETVNYVYDIRKIELAVIDPSGDKTDDVVVVPESLLKGDQPIHDEQLPFDIDVVQYMQNSKILTLKPGEKSEATAGIGLEARAEPRRGGSGASADEAVDMPSAYIKLVDKKTHEPLGTYLVTTALDMMVDLPPQTVKVGDTSYDLSLRFKRTYKPYSMKLADVRFDKYIGTQTAKNYSSDLHLTDASANVDRDVKIWMNNPLRFAGDTFYQSRYLDDGQREITILQVVSNAGWMIPYVACMLVATGMLAQFSITLLRFVRRRDGEEALRVFRAYPRYGLFIRAYEAIVARRHEAKAATKKVDKRSAPPMTTWDIVAAYFPAAVVLACAVWVAMAARQPRVPVEQMQIDEFGRLPVVYEGRVKPLDTLARNTLRSLSNYQTFIDESGGTPKEAPAIKWFLDLAARRDLAMKHKVLRIDNLELLSTLGLTRRAEHRYAISEFKGKLGEIERQARLIAEIEPAKLSVYQKKLMELVKKLKLLRMMQMAFEIPTIRQDREKAEQDLRAAAEERDAVAQMQAPLAVPPDSTSGKWETCVGAWFDGLIARAQGKEVSGATVAMTSMLLAYEAGKTEEFNKELASYETWLGDHKPADYDATKVDYEAFFNFFNPFYLATVLYIAAFLLVALGWLGWTLPLNRAAFWLLVFTLGVHTFALVSRIYISGRPPVTNLYSAAVFIGWGGVVLGLLLEVIYRLGIGSVIAAVAGFTTLLIATLLAGLSDGDTLGVLQAVLDTQFWLATHVVCITLGYTTTYIAGMLGVLYIIRGVFTPSLTKEVGKDLSRMIYGTLCFAMFFSFVGTVLGGLWADDSWGRFWGWDPKENGALIIVLWNALVLHARWGGMVRERGLAALAVVGNIVTSWSFFGVNELGVGLHSYGFTEGVLMALGIFVLTQLAIVACGALPKHMWWSGRAVG